MKTVGIIPGRKGSLRFPDKHLARLCGKPMFAYTLEAALDAKRLDRLVVSSDDPALEELARAYGVEFVPRPAELASDTAALDDAIRQVVRLLASRDGFHADLAITMQGNVPIRKTGQIDEVIARLERTPEATAVCTAQQLRFRPEWAKVITDPATGACEPFMNSDRGFRTQDYPKIFAMDGAVYGVRVSTLEATDGNRALHAWFGERLHLLVQDDDKYSLEVDYPDQARQAEHYLRAMQAAEA